MHRGTKDASANLKPSGAAGDQSNTRKRGGNRYVYTHGGPCPSSVCLDVAPRLEGLHCSVRSDRAQLSSAANGEKPCACWTGFVGEFRDHEPLANMRPGCQSMVPTASQLHSIQLPAAACGSTSSAALVSAPLSWAASTDERNGGRMSSRGPLQISSRIAPDHHQFVRICTHNGQTALCSPRRYMCVTRSGPAGGDSRGTE
ncbi:hypothetical protein V8C26DRAFT_129005 [Trichoderma gracile]